MVHSGPSDLNFIIRQWVQGPGWTPRDCADLYGRIYITMHQLRIRTAKAYKRTSRKYNRNDSSAIMSPIWYDICAYQSITKAQYAIYSHMHCCQVYKKCKPFILFLTMWFSYLFLKTLYSDDIVTNKLCHSLNIHIISALYAFNVYWMDCVSRVTGFVKVWG